MIKSKKTFLKLFTAIMVLAFLVSPIFISSVDAWSMKDEIDTIQNVDVTDNKAVEKTQSVMVKIIAVVRVVGVGISVIMLIVLAVKYMSSAPEGKAEIKKTMVPYVVGAIILFASSQLLAVIAEVAEGLTK